MKKFFVILMVALWVNGFSEAIDGSQSVYTGNGTKEVARGYTGISELYSLDGVFFNPASQADVRRLENSLTVGGLGSRTAIGLLGISYPFDFGVLSFNALYTGNAGNNPLGSLMGGELSLAKPITENLFVGAGLKFLYGSAATSDWSLALDLGAIVKNETSSSGFGFNDYSYGVVIRNIGKQISLSNYDSFPPITIGAGGSFFPVKFDFYKLKLLLDINLPVYPLGFNLGVGIENILFDFINIKAGYILSYPEGSGLSGVGPYALGIGLNGRFRFNKSEVDGTNKTEFQFKVGKEKLAESTEIGISYAFQPQRYNNVEEFAHFVTFDIAWGYYDEEKPALKLHPENEGYFSPNFDGECDSARINLNIKDNKLVDGWKLEIVDDSGKVVKEYKSIEKLKLRSLDFGKFIKQLISVKQSVDIPEYIEWNGQDENGNRVKDGVYYAVLTAWDENKNTAVSEKLPVYLDTVLPEIDVKPEYVIFSPNDDGAKDELLLKVKSKGIQEGDEITGEVKDQSGKVVKTFSFKSGIPEIISWDGKDDNNKLLPEGEYTLGWMAKDKAGNKTVIKDFRIVLVTTYQKVDVTASLDKFSPNNDGVKDSVVFYLKTSDAKGLEKWLLKIYGEGDSVVKTFEGKSHLPESILWDGKGDNKLTLKDGEYSYELQLFYDSGNHPVSSRKKIEIDTTPAELSVEPEYLSFSPNGDGKQDTLKFTHKISGRDDDQIEAKILNEVGNIFYYNKAKLKDFEKEFVWNGLDKDFKPLPEGKYSYIVESIDDVGNRSRFEVKNIFLKTGLEKISVQADVIAISPDNPEANKTATFMANLDTKKGIVNFEFDIMKGNEVIYTFKTNQYVEKIVWNGRDNKGKVVNDGTYNYILKVKYDFGDEPVSTPKLIVVDSVAPQIDIVTDDFIFSPNGDGRKDSLSIKQKVKGDSTDVYNASIINSKGEVVKTYSFIGNIPEEIIWDGKDNKGADLPEGVYTYRIEGIDSAKNRIVKEIKNVRLVRSLEKLSVSVNMLKFSRALQQKLAFEINVSSVENLDNAVLTVIDMRGTKVRNISLEKREKQKVEWDGSDDKNKGLPEGVYSVTVSFNYKSGNLISSTISNIILDSNPPEAKVTVSPEVFTPDGDGEDDVMFINLDLNDFTDVKEWVLKIHKKVEKKEDISIFKTFKGAGKGKTLIQWDGVSDDKEDVVEAVQDYVMELVCVDEVGNVSSNITEFTTGVLVERTPDGLRIRVSSILFAFDKATFVGDYKKPLDKIIYILRKIMSDPAKYGLSKNFKIEVSGHTDDVGTEEYNQKLSEKRAKTVYDYLVKNDIDPSILTSVGYGESRPYKIIKPGMPKEKVNEYRSRNRRVEFFIKK
ncbi:MAG: gliding motility-associated C-terminal domain-containing protein [Brevinematia bacterium]